MMLKGCALPFLSNVVMRALGPGPPRGVYLSPPRQVLEQKKKTHHHHNNLHLASIFYCSPRLLILLIQLTTTHFLKSYPRPSICAITTTPPLTPSVATTKIASLSPHTWSNRSLWKWVLPQWAQGRPVSTNIRKDRLLPTTLLAMSAELRDPTTVRLDGPFPSWAQVPGNV